ncbi:MAG TPA: diphosphate--fructose-6-phosphate 1-phosphotransferase [Rectinemataceae bacterium]|nr:diphosphate--fructose-6-phosphate 1-phosphotransferase [Rectinemataceae bacterium]
MSERSPLHNVRFAYIPKMPEIYASPVTAIKAVPTEIIEPKYDKKSLEEIFTHSYGKPAVKFMAGDNIFASNALTVGVLLSGGPAPGGHNVIAGLFDGLKRGSTESRLIGFKGGPGGLVDDKFIEITSEIVDSYRNTGGFDMVGSGRTKIETPEQFEKALAVATSHRLDALVIVGGDDSNTNAALLAEYFASHGTSIAVVGVPKTIDGDLKNEWIEASFGFDTATKTYSELIGNICRDAPSGRKYWHFIRVMGRSASHIALECALQTRPNVALISEEVEARKMSLSQIVDIIVSSVAARAAKGENFGVVIIPEGLIEFVPEMKTLIAGINELLAHESEAFKALPSLNAQIAFISGKLPAESAALFDSLPRDISAQLCWDRDPHGNVQVSRIETEKLLVSMVRDKLAKLAAKGDYRGKFDYQTHFMGYEGRCAFPTNFDADYCYSLGFTAYLLALYGFSGYIASIRNLAAPAREWIPGGIPLVSMMNIEHRHGADKPVIRKALVELDGKPFRYFSEQRDKWALSSDYRLPGAIQYFGPPAVTDMPSLIIQIERS